MKSEFFVLSYSIFPEYLCERSIVSAGIVLALGVTVIFALLVITRFVRVHCCCCGGLQTKVPRRNASREQVYPANASTPQDRAISGIIIRDESIYEGQDLCGIASAPPKGEDTPIEQGSFHSQDLEKSDFPSHYVIAASMEDIDLHTAELPRRNIQLHLMKALNAKHKNPELYNYAEYKNIPIPPNGTVHVPGQSMDEKLGSVGGRIFVVLNNRRVPYFNWTFGNILTVLLYLCLNVLCLLIAPDNHLGMLL